MRNEVTITELARTDEALRQERETFNQRKLQDHKWFVLRLTMGYSAIPFLTAIAFFCSYILLYWQTFPNKIVTSAAATLFVDVVGVVVGVWKVVLNPTSVAKLQPVTTSRSSGIPEQLPSKTRSSRRPRSREDQRDYPNGNPGNGE